MAAYVDDRIAADVRERATVQSGLRVAVVDVSEPLGDVATTLAEASARDEVVHVIGLDRLAFDREGTEPATRAVRALNLQRDDLASTVEARVVFWCSAEAYPQLAALAWDLLEVMLTRFELRGRGPEREATPVRRPMLGLEKLQENTTDPAAAARNAEAMLAHAHADTATVPNVDVFYIAATALAGAKRLVEALSWMDEVIERYTHDIDQRQGADALVELADALCFRAEISHQLGRAPEARADLERAVHVAETGLASAGVLFRWGLEQSRIRALWLRSFIDGADPLTCTAHDNTTERLDALLIQWWRGSGDAIRKILGLHLDAIERALLWFAAAPPGELLVLGAFQSLFRLATAHFEFRHARLVIFQVVEVTTDHRQLPHYRLSAPALEPLLDALDELPIEPRDLIELHYGLDLPISELAAMFGVVEPTLQYRLTRAVEQLLAAHERLTGERLPPAALRNAPKTSERVGA